MKLLTPLVFCAAASLAASAEPPPPMPMPMPMVGGPCSYETKETAAAVTGLAEDEILLVDDEGTRFRLPPAAFDPPAETGARYQVTKRYIVKGTCTPFSFSLIGPAPAETVEPAASEAGQ